MSLGNRRSVTVHTDLIHGEATGQHRVVGRVEVVDDLVIVSNQALDQLDELVLIPRFDLDSGEPISLTERPHDYLRQLAEDLGEATGLRTTPLHDDSACDYA